MWSLRHRRCAAPPSRSSPRRRTAARRSRRRARPAGPRPSRSLAVSSSTFVSTDIRRMNSSAASTTPTVTAITMSNNDGEHEASQHHHHVVARRDPRESHEVASLRHVARDDDQQAGERGHRQIRHQRCERDRAREHEDRVHRRRERRARIRRECSSRCERARRSPRCRRRTGHRMLPMPSAISSAVRLVARAGHAVGDDRRHQRFDRTEHRDRERRSAAARGSCGSRSVKASCGLVSCHGNTRQRWQRRDAVAL